MLLDIDHRSPFDVSLRVCLSIRARRHTDDLHLSARSLSPPSSLAVHVLAKLFSASVHAPSHVSSNAHRHIPLVRRRGGQRRRRRGRPFVSRVARAPSTLTALMPRTPRSPSPALPSEARVQAIDSVRACSYRRCPPLRQRVPPPTVKEVSSELSISSELRAERLTVPVCPPSGPRPPAARAHA